MFTYPELSQLCKLFNYITSLVMNWPKFQKHEFSNSKQWSFPVSNHIGQLNTKHNNLMHRKKCIVYF